MTTYGLHPSIWRKIRQYVGGTGYSVPALDHSGKVIGSLQIYRYSSQVGVEGCNFPEISWKSVVLWAQQHPDPSRLLGGSDIPIGINCLY